MRSAPQTGKKRWADLVDELEGRVWGGEDFPSETTCGLNLVDFVFLGGGNSNIFRIFTPKIGECFQFDEHIFQTGGKEPATLLGGVYHELLLIFPFQSVGKLLEKQLVLPLKKGQKGRVCQRLNIFCDLQDMFKINLVKL